jgi:adenosylmethionine-8-amino-7-oxononanoate aminotransferase
MQMGGINKPGAEKMFLISTTHGGETNAIAAALATLEVFQLNNVVTHNHNIGKLLSEQVRKLITEHSLLDYIEIVATDWMIGFSFLNSRREPCQGMRTLVMQEMISRGVLFQGSFIPCYSHSTSDVDYFIEAFNQTLAVYKNALEDGYEKFLVGMPAKPVFRKYI